MPWRDLGFAALSAGLALAAAANGWGFVRLLGW